MSVSVDNMRAKFGRMTMCHMIADTTEELLAMADTIGVQRKWIQDAGTPREHFDISLAKRALAIAAGATEISQKMTATVCLMRERGYLPMPDGTRWPIDESRHEELEAQVFAMLEPEVRAQMAAELGGPAPQEST